RLGLGARPVTSHAEGPRPGRECQEESHQDPRSPPPVRSLTPGPTHKHPIPVFFNHRYGHTHDCRSAAAGSDLRLRLWFCTYGATTSPTTTAVVAHATPSFS